jgi:transposase-like protein
MMAAGELREAAGDARVQHQLPPSRTRRPGRIVAGWTMIEVFDTAAAKIALARRMLRCPGCGQPLRPWGHARERTVRELGGALAPARPDRALCTGCGLTHVVLDAGLLPRRAYAAGVAGQALAAAALGHGHRRIARDLAVPAGTVRGWIRSARRSADQLRITGIQAVVALDPDALPARVHPDELGCALEHLAAAAMAMGSRFGLQHTSPWARINMLTRGRLLTMPAPG